MLHFSTSIIGVWYLIIMCRSNTGIRIMNILMYVAPVVYGKWPYDLLFFDANFVLDSSSICALPIRKYCCAAHSNWFLYFDLSLPRRLCSIFES